MPKCGHCGKTGTKALTIEPQGASYKQIAICCSWCDAILGITGFYDAGALLKQAEERQKKLERQVGSMAYQIENIVGILSRR